ncbi:hypothetical protein F511_37464 [Dorcoceras hygrometricum]|uniref:Uncharacterized protein n=1 Tax=Dorcoceras hygrometricum TaxID=472368 RepID=A0A2Z7ASQ4_9LAMI|nr:hypothetical protein F511_37464 [Dorcoceras hygrometricum]
MRITVLCSDIRNWIRNIEQHASDNVNKILVGNKADMDESKRAVPTSKGQALADEYGIQFFETSAKTNLNVEQVFFLPPVDKLTSSTLLVHLFQSAMLTSSLLITAFSSIYADVIIADSRSCGGRSSQSGPRPEARVLRQSALEELTKFPRMESPPKEDRNKSDHGGGAAVEGRRP